MFDFQEPSGFTECRFVAYSSEWRGWKKIEINKKNVHHSLLNFS